MAHGDAGARAMLPWADPASTGAGDGASTAAVPEPVSAISSEVPKLPAESDHDDGRSSCRPSEKLPGPVSMPASLAPSEGGGGIPGGPPSSKRPSLSGAAGLFSYMKQRLSRGKYSTNFEGEDGISGKRASDAGSLARESARVSSGGFGGVTLGKMLSISYKKHGLKNYLEEDPETCSCYGRLGTLGAQLERVHVALLVRRGRSSKLPDKLSHTCTYALGMSSQ